MVAAQATLELERRRAEAELRSARAGYGALHGVARDVLDATSEADAVISAATAAFEAGESTLTDLLETLESVVAARSAALELHHSALAAHRRLEMSVGRAPTDGGAR